MSILDSQAWKLQEAGTAAEEDRRLHRRFALPLAGRFMRADKSEQTCVIKDVSVGGVAVVHGETSEHVTQGERVIVYVDQLGGLEGVVVRVWNDGFAFGLTATQYKREKLAAQITWLLNEQDLKGAAQRKHERVVVGNRMADLHVAGAAVTLPCLVLDVSVSGASLACKTKPDIDTEVRLMGLRARVVRHHHEGVGVQFVDVLDLDTVQSYFG